MLAPGHFEEAGHSGRCHALAITTPMQFVRPKTARLSIEQARGLEASSWAQNALLRTSIFRTPLLACIRQFVVEFDAFYQ